MGQASIKEARRQIRRTVGPAALDTLRNLENGVQSLETLVHVVRANVGAVAVDHALVKKRVDELASDMVHVRARVESLMTFRMRGFMARLRWLLTGR